MTCSQCGMTIGWDCECDPEYNALVEEARRQEPSDCPQPHVGYPGGAGHPLAHPGFGETP